VTYRIEYLESAVREDIPALAKMVRTRIRAAIEQKLASHPVEFGKPLRYSLKGARRLRVGDWRVVYTIEPPNTVLIVKIGHRREIYES
jgi:mRNA-degrading endonuclease RelE of RelBE toxin-antitoxin system